MADSPLVPSPAEPSVYGQRLASGSPFTIGVPSIKEAGIVFLRLFELGIGSSEI